MLFLPRPLVLLSAGCLFLVSGCESPNRPQVKKASTVPTALGQELKPEPPKAQVIGAIDLANCSHIAGWARNMAEPKQRLTIEIRADGNLIATTVADKLRPDLQKKNIGDGLYGYFLATPQAIKDGKEHVITASILSAGEPLKPGPKTLTCKPAQ
jgi:hypothetical protein